MKLLRKINNTTAKLRGIFRLYSTQYPIIDFRNIANSFPCESRERPVAPRREPTLPEDVPRHPSSFQSIVR